MLHLGYSVNSWAMLCCKHWRYREGKVSINWDNTSCCNTRPQIREAECINHLWEFWGAPCRLAGGSAHSGTLADAGLCSFQHMAFKVTLILGTPANRKRGKNVGGGWGLEWNTGTRLGNSSHHFCSHSFLPESSYLPYEDALNLMGKISMWIKGRGSIGLKQ